MKNNKRQLHTKGFLIKASTLSNSTFTNIIQKVCSSPAAYQDMWSAYRATLANKNDDCF